MLSFILKYRTIIMFGVLLLANVVNFGLGYWKGYSAGKEAEQNKAIEKVVTIREKQNEIRNNRPDAAALIDSLRDGTF